jgi:hypothetical protein
LRIFILDDVVQRQLALKDWVTENYNPDEILIADSFDSAKEILDKIKEYDIILLDHDLGQQVFVNSDDYNTGYQVAKYIISQGIKYNQVIVHSMNYAGAQRMVAILPNSKYIPIIVLLSQVV